MSAAQLALFDGPLPPPGAFRFDGATYDPDQDHARLCRQAQVVFDLMRDGAWRTLAEIEAGTGEPQASVSARLRDFRKERFGGYRVERRRRTQGQFEYRVNS